MSDGKIADKIPSITLLFVHKKTMNPKKRWSQNKTKEKEFDVVREFGTYLDDTNGSHFLFYIS